MLNLYNIEVDEEKKMIKDFNDYKFKSHFELASNDCSDKIAVENNCINFNEKNYSLKNWSTASFKKLFKNKGYLYFITSDVINKKNIEIFIQNTRLLLESLKNARSHIDSIITFDENTSEQTWVTILQENLNYQKEFLQFASDLINKGDILNFKNHQKKVDDWKKNNINPLEKFAEKFNILLEKINLEVELYNTNYLIPLKNKITNDSIPIELISTGTKQLLLTALPLFKLETNNAIILIDEPERSLYPDMQMDLMKFYQDLAPNAQFIIATHSPFIAASFEPEERFILYFNEKGEVSFKNGTSPIGDDPNDILKNDFKVDYFNDYGKEAYQKYLNLKEKIQIESSPQKKKKLLLEATKLGDLYNF